LESGFGVGFGGPTGPTGAGGAGAVKHANPSAPAGNEKLITVFAGSAPVIIPLYSTFIGAPFTGAKLHMAKFGTAVVVDVPSASVTIPLVATPQHTVPSVSPHLSSAPVHAVPAADG